MSVLVDRVNKSSGMVCSIKNILLALFVRLEINFGNK